MEFDGLGYCQFILGVTVFDWRHFLSEEVQETGEYMDVQRLIDFTEDQWYNIINNEGDLSYYPNHVLAQLQIYSNEQVAEAFSNLKQNADYNHDVLDQNITIWCCLTGQPFVPVTRDKKVIKSHVINPQDAELDFNDLDDTIAIGSSTGPGRHWNGWLILELMGNNGLCQGCFHAPDRHNNNKETSVYCAGSCNGIIMESCIAKVIKESGLEETISEIDDAIHNIFSEFYQITCKHCSDSGSASIAQIEDA